MTQGIARPLTGQLVTYRHQALAAPTMLDEGLLAPSHVAGVVAQHGFGISSPFYASCRMTSAAFSPII